MKKILINKAAYPVLFLLALLILITSGCKREKLDNTIPLLNVSNTSASSIRFYNYYGATDVTVNNTPLTDYSTANSSNIGGGTAIGLSLFPSGVWTNGDDASPFTLPNSLLDKNGGARFKITPRAVNIYGVTLPQLLDTTIINNVAHPQDYYLMPDGHIKVINRDNLPPANTQNFKIRILNFGDTYDQLGLIGPVSLTYADGSPVSTSLTNVAQGISTPYIELPYGPYQFKLFVAGGGIIDVTRQLAEMPDLPYYDPCNPSIRTQQGISPRVRTFKPGGVYSIVVTDNGQELFSDCTHFAKGIAVNSYRVITELDPGVNSTYAALQAVNALPGKSVTINVDGKPLGGQLPYIGSVTSNTAQQPPYQIYVQGTHHIQAVENGTVLAEGDLKLYPYDNYTIWAYNKPDGKPAVFFEANDMTGTLYTSTYHPGNITIPDDGTNGTARRTQFNYALESRFLNLAPDLPYATFTNDHQLFLPAIGPNGIDTIRYFSAYVNLMPGTNPARNPSIVYSLTPQSPGQANQPAAGGSEALSVPGLIRVYQSTPGNHPEVPGALLPDIAPVNVLQAFIANPNLYTVPQFTKAETGVYTVALVGKINASQASEKARIIVIKHNK